MIGGSLGPPLLQVSSSAPATKPINDCSFHCQTPNKMPLTSAAASTTASTIPVTLSRHRLLRSPTMAPRKQPFLLLRRHFPARRISSGTVRCSLAPLPRGSSYGAYDPELRLVLELATDSELYEIGRILFGPSYLSPLIKSIASRSHPGHVSIEDDVEERECYISALESQFLFLAADARSTLRGWRPTYRNVLLAVREKLSLPCSSKLSTEDLEAEIFLHAVHTNASEFPNFWEELQSFILKGSGILTLSRVYQLISSKLTGKVLFEAANYQVKKEIIKKGAQLASINLESRVALLAAKRGLSGAASRYIGFRSMMSFLGPVLWGTFLADVVIQMLGTDYARILPAIYAFAQIRITRTYAIPANNDTEIQDRDCRK